MRAITSAIGLLALAAVLFAACGETNADAPEQGADTAIVTDTTTGSGDDRSDAPPVEPIHLGQVSEFSQGINELNLPRRVFIVVDADEIAGFDRKDPNNGCVLFAINGAAATFEIDDENARFFDECHGNTYDVAGQPLHCAESRAMRSIEILVEDGIAKWAGLIVDPEEPDALSASQCPTP